VPEKIKNRNGNEKEENHLSASFITGAVALVFLIIGYQTALFVHRAAALKILSDRDNPDTVYVIDRTLAMSVLDNCNRDELKVLVSNDKSVLKSKNENTKIFIRRNSAHEETAAKVASSLKKRHVENFKFDPNTISSEDLVRLGFSEKQAGSIVNYRNKGGRFHRRRDFARSYVVSDSVFRRLEPYITIPKLDINSADSAAFDALPGIGKYFASKMVSYRKRLGGYSYTGQLMDIYHFDKDRFDAISDLIKVDPQTQKAYKLWTLPADSLRLHPYILSYAADGIVLYREHNPKTAWTVENLAVAGVLKPDLAGKLERCIIEKP
jgi:DNA uptake protein ComE-like DNA-binding protein